jgi:hypothetical protein
MSDINASATGAPITVSVSGGQVSASVGGGQGPQGPTGPAGGAYTLPAATSTILGGVKIGSNLSVTVDGTLSSTASSGAWADITGKPSTFAPSAHATSHGSLGGDPITVAVSQVTGLQTALDGKQAAGSYAPLTHTHTASAITDFSSAVAAAIPASVVVTTDSRLTNSRSPTSHASSHASAGADAVTLTIAQTTGLQAALDLKAPLASPTFTGTVSGITKAAVGLGNVDNTADASKPISTAQAAADAAVQAYAIQRAMHTGTQAASTVTGLAAVATSGSYLDLGSRPTLGTAAPLDVPATGNASSTQVVKGSDSRLSDSRTPSSTLSHASTHAAAGSDPVTLTIAQTTGLQTALDAKVATSSLATVATTGAYNDLSGRPSIPTAYTLPNATASILGGITVSTGLAVSSGAVSVSYGTTGSTACAGNDSRLSDTRTPADGTVTDAKIATAGLSPGSIAWAAIAPWAASTAYAKGDLVSYLGVAYRRTTAGTSGTTFSSSMWTQITPTLSTVAVSGAYADLSGTPASVVTSVNGATGAVTAQKTITSGTAAPSGGSDGDIYLRYT